MIKVAITDDHPLVREGIKLILNDEKDIQVISEASRGHEFFANIHSEMPDIVVLDLSMPSESGLEVLKRVNQQFPDLPILILSLYPAKAYAIRCLKDGASGYLDKVSTIDQLAKAIRHIVNKKKKYITKDVARILPGNLNINDGGGLYEGIIKLIICIVFLFNKRCIQYSNVRRFFWSPFIV